MTDPAKTEESKVTHRDQDERRAKVRELFFARGMRSFLDIAKLAGCSYMTVKKDIVIIRRRMRTEHVNDRKINVIREAVAEGYVKDILKLNDLIDMAIADAGIESEETQDKQKKEDFIKRIEKRKGRNYQAIALLYQRLLEARRKLSELYDIVQNENVKVDVTATAKASADIDLNGIPDADVIATGKGILNRIAQT